MISVCFITKNEEKWLGECIEHLKPLVTEFIVLDTGSTDRTKEIAKGLGAKVFESDWPGNFAEARNKSLAYASQPWILRIDPDERVSPEDQRKLYELTSSDDDGFQCATRHYTNSAGCSQFEHYARTRGEFPEYEKNYKGYKVDHYTRLFRRLPEIHYVGLVHENVDQTLPESNGRKKLILRPDIIFHHYGNDPAEVKLKDKSPLYRRLMREELSLNPTNWYIWHEQAMLEFEDGNLEASYQSFMRAYELCPEHIQIPSNLGYVCLLLGRRDEARVYLNASLQRNINQLSSWLNLGACEYEDARYESANDAFLMALRVSPDSFHAYRGLGQVAAKSGNLALAERMFLTSINVMPEFLESKVDLAMLYAFQNRNKEAANLLQEVLERDPSHFRAKAVHERLATSTTP